LNEKRKTFQRLLKEEIIARLCLPVDRHCLKPVFLVDDAVRFHLENRMADVLLIYRIRIMCNRIRGKMTEITRRQMPSAERCVQH